LPGVPSDKGFILVTRNAILLESPPPSPPLPEAVIRLV
jgi:hypothetical protein